MSKQKQTLFIIAGIIGALILIEALSGLVILASHRIYGTPKRISLFRFHPLFTRSNIFEYEKSWSERFPGVGYTNRVHYSDECGYTTDRYGFIHNGDKTRTIGPNDFTIFIVGGSSVAGHGATCNDQTISAHLEKVIGKRYQGIKVINAGVAGYTSAQEFEKIAHQIMFYNPDIVISFNGANDFAYDYTPYKNREHTYFVNGYQRGLYKTLDDTKSLWWSVKNLIYNATRFTEYTYTRFVLTKGISFLKGRTRSSSNTGIIENVESITGADAHMDEDIEYDDTGFQEELDRKMYYYLGYIEETAALVTGLGKKYFYILQPVLYTETRRLPKTEEKARDIARKAFYLSQGKDVVARAEYFWSNIDAGLHASNRPYYHSLREVFSDDDEVYSDYVHYNDHGNSQIARRMYEILIGNNAIPSRYLRQ